MTTSSTGVGVCLVGASAGRCVCSHCELAAPQQSLRLASQPVSGGDLDTPGNSSREPGEEDTGEALLPFPRRRAHWIPRARLVVPLLNSRLHAIASSGPSALPWLAHPRLDDCSPGHRMSASVSRVDSEPPTPRSESSVHQATGASPSLHAATVSAQRQRAGSADESDWSERERHAA
jgi:hypothetical protein